MIQDTEAIPPAPPPVAYVPTQHIAEAMRLAECERRIMTIPCADLTDSLFDFLWSRDDPYPILVTQANQGLQLDWDPPFFSKTFFNYPCQVQNCSTGEEFGSSVDQLFSRYGLCSNVGESWCIKVLHVHRHPYYQPTYIDFQDWPPAEDFKTVYPYCILCNDLLRTVPVPDVLRPDGCRNAISYFLAGRAKPDLGQFIFNRYIFNRYSFWFSNIFSGPKMYAATEDDQGVGSTKLHGDVADAFNLCTFTDRKDGYALWTIFLRKDAPKVAEYILELNLGSGNPIYQQQTQLTATHLDDLYRKKGVRPFVIRQGCGDMVLIPAGDPHQVRHYRSLLKGLLICIPTCILGQ